MSEQLYLIRISAMNTCDECDVVPSAEFVAGADFKVGTQPIMEALATLAQQISHDLIDIPVDNLRPMTREEVQAWREEKRAQDDGDIELVLP